MSSLSVVPSLVGGVLIGVSSVVLFAGHGRIAGISGIAFGVARTEGDDRAWRVKFLAGLLVGAIAWLLVRPAVFGTVSVSASRAVIAGLLVGAGTYLGNGCTSGHGVCGLSRRSPRSLAAVLTFMGVAMVTVFLTRAFSA